MIIIELAPAEVDALAAELAAARERAWSVLVAVDGMPHERELAFKVKIGGGVWSPPMGARVPTGPRETERAKLIGEVL